MENNIYELILEMKKEIMGEMYEIKDEMKEMKVEMRDKFNTLHKRIDGLEIQTRHGFREIKGYIDNRNKEKELMIDFMQDKITELERKVYEQSKK